MEQPPTLLTLCPMFLTQRLVSKGWREEKTLSGPYATGFVEV
jgi:hypothetical protein